MNKINSEVKNIVGDMDDINKFLKQVENEKKTDKNEEKS